MDYKGTKDYLFGLKGTGAKFGIDRMRLFVEALGNPQKRLRIIHVAGTNGKGSVSAMCESVCRVAGLRTGFYSSPHLVRLGERVQVNREILSEEKIVAYTSELREVAERISADARENHPTFFEFMTAMAFLHFVREEVDVAVLEVGLGGRLDATNVVEPLVSVITSIGLDHREQLGSTLGEVAREKGGIVKPGVPVVIGLMADEAREVIEGIAKERGAPLFSVADVFGRDPAGFPETALSGDHQRMNAATVSLVFRTLRERLPVSDDDLSRGLRQVKWAGRWDVREISGRKVIFEAAHNPQGAEVLDAQLGRLVAEDGRRPVIVVGALGEERARALMRTVSRHASRILLLAPDQPRATPVDRLRELIPADFGGGIEGRRVEELFGEGECRAGEPGGTVVVTGSIYLIGEVLARLEVNPVAEGRLQD